MRFSIQIIGIALISIALFLVVLPAVHALNIVVDSPPAYNQWAWNDVVGWIDFYTTGDVDVLVSGLKIDGYATSVSIGEIALDCATTPIPPSPDCITAGDWHVSNDTNGNLAGWAWNDAVGWISFCGNSSGGSIWNGSTWDCPVSPTYQVTIVDQGDATSDFFGWAWNDVIGWISFNCDRTPSGGSDTCETVDYKVKTSWTSGPPPPSSAELTSNTFDTCALATDCGAQINTIMWTGSAHDGTVKFQIASSDCKNGETNPPTCNTGTWNYIGEGGTSATFYGPGLGPGKLIKIDYSDHNNNRYVRYKVLIDDTGGLPSPIVEEIIINWSP